MEKSKDKYKVAKYLVIGILIFSMMFSMFAGLVSALFSA